MPAFRYIVRDQDGNQIKGIIEGENREAVAASLKEKNYTPTSISLAEKPSILDTLINRFRKVKLSEKNVFSRQLLTLIRAGVPLIESLNAVRQQTSDKILKQAIAQIIRDIKEGASFSESLKKHPKCFDKLYVNMIKAGEEGGILEDTLERLANLGEHEEKIQRNIKAATRYPVLVIVAMIIGFSILITVVLPRYASIFSNFKTDLPLPTLMLLQVYNILSNYWHLALLITGTLIFIIHKYINTEKGRKYWDLMKLKIPVLGKLFLKLTMSRFTRAVASLMRTGIPIITLLELVTPSLGNKIIEDTIIEMQKDIKEGTNISESVKKHSIFPPIVYQMIAIGEKTGNLDELLFKVSEYYDSQADYMINNLSSLIEPFLLLILGGGVLLMALAIFLPMWNLVSLFQ